MIRLSEIEALARAATPGPWVIGSVSSEDGSIGITKDRYYIALVTNAVSLSSLLVGTKPDAQWANAAHIAGMRPDVALRMVEALRAAREYMRVCPADEDLTPAFQAATNALRAALSEIQE